MVVIERWIDGHRSLKDHGIAIGATAPLLQLRVRWFKTYFKLVDTTALYLLFVQFNSLITSGAYPVSDKVATRLAAIVVQINYGNFVRAKHRPGFFTCVDYFLSLESQNC